MNQKKKMNRWYDANPELSELLEKISEMTDEKKTQIFEELKKIIKSYDSDLIDRHVFDFPMNLKRRWYDKEPDSWLIVNSLKYVNTELMGKVILYLKENL